MASDIETVGVLALFGLTLTINGFRARKKLQHITETPTSTIRSISMGRCEIKGKTIRTTEVYTSPISKKECLYYSIDIQKEVRRNRETTWETIYSDTKGNYVYVQDNTGTVLVDIRGANIHMKTTNTLKGVRAIQSFIDENTDNTILEAAVKKTFGMRPRIRTTETIIPINCEVYVNGDAQDNPFVEDGSVQEGHKDIMITKPERDNLLISDKTEEELTRKYRWGQLGIIFGPLMIIGAVAYIIMS